MNTPAVASRKAYLPFAAPREELKKCCERSNPPITPKQMVRPVATRWNSMAQAVTRALELRPALEMLLAHPKHTNTKDKSSLGRLALSTEEREVMLEPVLNVRSCFL